MPSNIAIIPARGGSKRIPRKNIRLFNGKPLIAYPIETAIESKLFDKIIVSTDDEEIRGLAISLGAEAPFLRSKENSTDLATTADVLLEVLLDLKKDAINFDNFCCIYPTSPLITSNNLIHSYEKFFSTRADTLISTCRFSYPPQRALICNEFEKISLERAEYEQTRSQDLPPLFHDAGQFYWANTSKFEENKTLFTSNTIGYELSELEAQDIDNEIDWTMALLKHSLAQNVTK